MLRAQVQRGAASLAITSKPGYTDRRVLAEQHTYRHRPFGEIEKTPSWRSGKNCWQRGAENWSAIPGRKTVANSSKRRHVITSFHMASHLVPSWFWWPLARSLLCTLLRGGRGQKTSEKRTKGSIRQGIDANHNRRRSKGDRRTIMWALSYSVLSRHS
jgi:hypothetical protein